MSETMIGETVVNFQNNPNDLTTKPNSKRKEK
jgi:hypothetical protein